MPAVLFQPRPRRTFIVLGFIWMIFVATYGASQYVKNHRKPLSEKMRAMVNMLDLDAPGAIPQAYQALCLFLISSMCFVIGRQRKQAGATLSIYWKTLSVIFLFLTFDGLCNIHNQFHVHTATSQEDRDKQGIFYYSWTIAYGVALIPIGLWFLRFLLKLPRKFGALIAVAGVIFVIGALGMEMVYGLFKSRGHGVTGNNVTQILVTTEESLEMLGEMLMIYACLWYMAESRISSTVVPTVDPATGLQTGDSGARVLP